MITFDQTYKQVLTSACMHCQDPYFAPATPSMTHVGCCSYSPVLGLFEIYQMTKKNKDFFLDSIYQHKAATIKPYEIIINAEVDPLYYHQKTEHLSSIEKDDFRLQYSVCQFFEANKGCCLPASFKNSTCRSFICVTVEQQLDEYALEQVKKWNILIKHEVNSFVLLHRNELQKRGLHLQTNVQGVIDYLTNSLSSSR